MKSNNYVYSYECNDKIKLFLIFLLLLKPFKVFKILGKKQNKALEDFYSYLSENYYLEQLMKFLIYFLIFFLFIHFLVCLHLFLSLQSYPNWVIHLNIINESLFSKYTTSFYFMITTMTTVGYGDVVCISFVERIYHINEEIKLNKDLNILENIRVTYPSMPFKLYSKIKNHLLSIFNKRKKNRN